MKISNFRRKKSFIIGLKDEKVKKKRNWDQIFYFSVLLILLGIGSYFLMDYICYVSGRGQMVMENISVRIPYDVRILKFYKKEGDAIKAGDSLFSYEDNQSNLLALTDSFHTYAHSNPEWLERELFSLHEKQTWNNAAIQELKKQLTLTGNECREALIQVKLNVLPYSNYQKVKGDLESLKSRIKILEEENETSSAMSEALMKKLKGINSGVLLKEHTYFEGDSSGAQQGTGRIFYAPADGFLGRILKKPSELSLKEEDILLLQRNDKLFVRAYFDQKYIREIKLNDTIRITFPDDTKSTGIVKQLHTGAYPAPDEFQQKPETDEFTFGVDIFPLDTTALSDWRPYNGLSVNIFKSKFK